MHALAYYLHQLDPFIFHITETIGPRWYGFAYVMAFICGYALLVRLARKGYADIQPAQAADYITWAALFGVMIGGRLGYVLFYKPEMLRAPLSIFKVWEGGMSAHGGFLGLVLFTFYYARKHKISYANLGDNLVTVAPIGLFFGRCANFINGELYGRTANVPWAMQFPKELSENYSLGEKAVALAQQIHPAINSTDEILQAFPTDPKLEAVLRQVLTPRHPSQIYEALLEGVLLFAILYFVRTRLRTPNGIISGLFLILYAAFRFTVEFFREPDASMIGPFTHGQFLSFFLILIGLGFITYAVKSPTYPKRLIRD